MAATFAPERASAEAAILHPAYPNPMRGGLSTIPFSVSHSGPVKLRVLDHAGRVVRVLLDETAEPGGRSVTWDGRNDRGEPVPAGIYFYQLETSGFEVTRKMIRLR